MANTTASTVAFSILSPDASLSYDRIKLRLEEYRTLLASDSDTIELSTENGKTVICRQQANEMEKYLDQAEILLQDVVQSRDISTLIVLHHLRDLAEVLDNLKLYDECRLTGNCALDLAEALGHGHLSSDMSRPRRLHSLPGSLCISPVLVLSSSRPSPSVRKWWPMMPHTQINISSLWCWAELAPGIRITLVHNGWDMLYNS